jgi:HEAT repeat protein
MPGTGEQRATSLLVGFLSDKARDAGTRLLAARALGLLKSASALDTLLPMAEDENTNELVRIEVFRAIGRVKDNRSLATLERVKTRPLVKLPGGYGPDKWALEAQAALRQIRGERP